MRWTSAASSTTPQAAPPENTTTSEQRAPARPGSDPASQPTTTGGELAGAVATSSRSNGDSQGVLAATERVGRSASLPFTGNRVWMTVLFGLSLIAAGLALRQIRTAEAAVESGHEHTNRARHAARGSRPPVRGRTGR